MSYYQHGEQHDRNVSDYKRDLYRSETTYKPVYSNPCPPSNPHPLQNSISGNFSNHGSTVTFSPSFVSGPLSVTPSTTWSSSSGMSYGTTVTLSNSSTYASIGGSTNGQNSSFQFGLGYRF